MESILGNMQITVTKYANVLSEILKVDVEIVDNKLNRIAGTGRFKDKINGNMANEGYVYKKVIKTGKPQIIHNPGEHNLCKTCPNYTKCDETFEISTPIKLNDNVIGVIGFICFTKSQKDHIYSNYKSFIKFLDQISDLISFKAKEEIEHKNEVIYSNLLNNIMDRIYQGVVIVNSENKVIKINKVGANILNIDNINDVKNLVFKPTGSHMGKNKEYEVLIKEKPCKLIGEEYKISLEGKDENKYFVFNGVDWVKKQALSIVDSSKDIELDEIIGQSEKIIKLKEGILKIARHPSTILITGESGTGKELFARAIHRNSNRRERPFVAINCGAIPESLIESELFGYERGSFTGADPRGKIGKFELANNGTIFLDEIGDLPLYMQVKLLRVLQEKKVVKIGSNKSIDIDVRIIAATNKKLEEMIEDNTFREDLYYRLNVIPIQIPSLRERREDIKILSDYFIKKYSNLLNKIVIEIDDKIWDKFYDYKWPGNIRELENTIEFMINMVDDKGVLSLERLPKRILDYKNEEMSIEGSNSLNLSEIEKNTIIKALKIYGDTTNGKKIAAKELGLGIATLYRKLEKYELSK